MEDADKSSSPVPAPYSNRKGHQRIWLLAVALIGVGSFFFFQRQGETQSKSNKPAGPPPAVPITVATARKGDIGDYVNALGYVTPVNMVTVRTRVDGQLMSVNFREGQIVHEGDTLAEIDPRLFQAQLTQAEGQYDRDKALLEEAQLDLARYQEAYAKNAIPRQQLDVQRATVRQDEGTVKVDLGQVESARVNLLYCTIKSPITGRVGLRLVDPGNIVHAGDTNGLLVIMQLQPITVVFSVAEDYVPQIQQPLRRKQRLTVEALDRTQQNKLATGAVSALDNEIDATTGTVKLRALFPNSNNALFPNQFVNTRLLIATERGVTLIPTAAVQRNGDTAYVYLVKPDQTVEMRNITAGTTDGDVTAVQGVVPGDVVAADGFDKLQDGVKVAIRQGSGKGEGESQQGGQEGQK